MCEITLDALSEMTGVDPCTFQGLVFPGQTCPSLDCKTRNIWSRAFFDSFSLGSAHLDAHGYKLCDTVETVYSRTPSFSTPHGACSVARKTRVVTAGVGIDPGMPQDTQEKCRMKAVVIGNVALDAGERIVSLRVKWDTCKCKRLGVEWCDEPRLEDIHGTVKFTAYARAYNFIDIDANPGCINHDQAVYLESVDVEIVTERQACARVYWMPRQGCSCGCDPHTGPCGPDCPKLSACELCVLKTGPNACSIQGWECTKPCGVDCLESPVMFSLDVVRPGMWRDAWARAMLALAHQRIPFESCDSCNPMSSLLYKLDTELPNKTNPYYYRNGFGIYTPGARMAWDTFFAGLTETTVTTL